jgi:hypothetical protein
VTGYPLWPLPMGVPIPAHLATDRSDAMPLWDRLRYFRPDEFRHPDSLASALLLKLDDVRHYAGLPIEITSDYRPGDTGAHGQGKAVDITQPGGISSHWRYMVLRAAYRVGIHRIGVYDSHIHLDIADDLPPEVCWWGQSR